MHYKTMDLDKDNDEELKQRFDHVIEKSNIQVKILKKILNELNKKNNSGIEKPSSSSIK